MKKLPVRYLKKAYTLPPFFCLKNLCDKNLPKKDTKNYMKLLDSYFATTKKDVKLVNISPKKNKVLYILKKKNDVKLSDISPAKTVWYY